MAWCRQVIAWIHVGQYILHHLTLLCLNELNTPVRMACLYQREGTTWDTFLDHDNINVALLAEPLKLIMDACYIEWEHLYCHIMGRDSVSNHQPDDYLLNRLFRRRSKKTSKLRVTGLCAGNSPMTGEFPAQMASNTENVSIWWRHHVRGLNCHTIGHYRTLTRPGCPNEMDTQYRGTGYVTWITRTIENIIMTQ